MTCTGEGKHSCLKLKLDGIAWHGLVKNAVGTGWA